MTQFDTKEFQNEISKIKGKIINQKLTPKAVKDEFDSLLTGQDLSSTNIDIQIDQYDAILEDLVHTSILETLNILDFNITKIFKENEFILKEFEKKSHKFKTSYTKREFEINRLYWDIVLTDIELTYY